MNYIVQTYSQLADQYDEEANLNSCWGRLSEEVSSAIRLKRYYRCIVDVGCGTGKTLVQLAAGSAKDIQFIGVEPAPNMCEKARKATHSCSNVRICRGLFEEIPLVSSSVDYLYSILAFHWTTNVSKSIEEMARVLKPDGEMDLYFIGRNNGHEFVKETTPIFLKYMGPALLLESAGLRQQLTKEAAIKYFQKQFNPTRLELDESHITYYDTLEGHWSWWVRIEGHFVKIPPDKRSACDCEVKRALERLSTPKGIPYTVHLLHVKVRT